MTDAKINHWLLTVHTLNGVNVHGYLMCANKIDTNGAINKLIDVTDQLGLVHTNIIMQTKLSTGVSTVRNIMRGISNEAAQCLKEATDFHFSCFTTPVNSAEDMTLSELH